MLNKRTLKDANLSVTKALPAANATNYSDAIATSSPNPGRTAGERAELLVELPATPSLVDDKTVTLVVQDSADNSAWADVADLPSIVATGAGGAGAAAIERRFPLPIGLRQYVRLKQTVLASGGDNTGVSSTLSFVF